MGKILPFGEWLPDQPAFANPGNVTTLNCAPRTPSSYGAIPTPVPYSAALPSQVCGSYGYRQADGTVNNFCATVSDLYMQTTGSPNFTNVDGPSAPYTTDVPPDGFWSMTSFGNRIIATNYNNNIQTFLIGTDTAFSDLSSAAPRARYCCVIRDFVMFGDIYDQTDGPVAYRVCWPAIGNPTLWYPWGSQNAIEVQSDFQDLQQTDLGNVAGITGGHLSSADGAIFCDSGIWRVGYVGSPAIFDFAVAEGAAGTSSPLSIVERRLASSTGIVSAVDYYLSTDGFCAFDGGASVPIGAEKVDRFFFADLDPNYIRAVQGTYDPQHKLVMWFYHGAGNNGLFNRALIYNWELSRWAPIELTLSPVEWVEGLTFSSAGYTLDELDQFGNLDGPQYPPGYALKFSLDSMVWTAGNAQLSWFDGNHVQNFLTGPSMAATIETGEQQLFPGRRARIISTRPIADSVVPVTIAVGTREMTRATVTYQADIPENIIGDCPQRCTGRYVRFQMKVPAGANFNHLQGIDVTAVQEGVR